MAEKYGLPEYKEISDKYREEEKRLVLRRMALLPLLRRVMA